MNKGELILDGIPHDVTAQLLDYLGNSLSAEEREAFERRLLEDEFFSRQVEEAEFLILEAYAEGSLPEPVSERIASWVAASRRSHQHVEITRSLRRITAPQAYRRSPRRWLWAVAAAACIAAIAIYPLRHRRHISAPAPLRAGNTPNLVPSPPSVEDTVLLVAERLRGNAPVATPTLTYYVHPDMPVRLQIVVPSARPGSDYAVVLRRAGANAPIARFGTVQLQGSPQSPFLEVMLPPHTLEQGDYTAELGAPGERFHLQFRTAGLK